MENQNFESSLKTCPSCGTANSVQSRFCIKCGISFVNQTEQPNIDANGGFTQGDSVVNQNLQQPFQTQTVVEQSNLQPVSEIATPVTQTVFMQNSNITNGNINQDDFMASNKINYFRYYLNSLIKPHKTFKDHEENLNSFNNSGLLSLILIIFLTLGNLLTTIINTVRVESFWTGEVEWVWENVKNIKFLEIIGKNTLSIAVILGVITGVYFIAALIMKKEVKFPKLLGITVTSYAPIAIVSVVLSPLFNIINTMFNQSFLQITSTFISVGIIFAGFIYGLIILIELMDDAIPFDNKDTKIYFHMVCLSIIVVALLLIAYYSMQSAIGSLF